MSAILLSWLNFTFHKIILLLISYCFFFFQEILKLFPTPN